MKYILFIKIAGEKSELLEAEMGSKNGSKGGYEYSIEVYFQKNCLVGRKFKTRYPKLLNNSFELLILELLDNIVTLENMEESGLMLPFTVEFSDNLVKYQDESHLVYMKNKIKVERLISIPRILILDSLGKHPATTIKSIYSSMIRSIIELIHYIRDGYNVELKSNREFDQYCDEGFESGKVLLYTIKTHFTALSSIDGVDMEIQKKIHKLKDKKRIRSQNILESYGKFITIMEMIQNKDDCLIEDEVGGILKELNDFLEENPDYDITIRDADRIRNLYLDSLYKNRTVTADEVNTYIKNSQDFTNEINFRNLLANGDDNGVISNISKLNSHYVHSFPLNSLASLLNKDLRCPLNREPVPKEKYFDLTSKLHQEHNLQIGNYETPYLEAFVSNSNKSAKIMWSRSVVSYKDKYGTVKEFIWPRDDLLSIKRVDYRGKKVIATINSKQFVEYSFEKSTTQREEGFKTILQLDSKLYNFQIFTGEDCVLVIKVISFWDNDEFKVELYNRKNNGGEIKIFGTFHHLHHAKDQIRKKLGEEFEKRLKLMQIRSQAATPNQAIIVLEYLDSVCVRSNNYIIILGIIFPQTTPDSPLVSFHIEKSPRNKGFKKESIRIKNCLYSLIMEDPTTVFTLYKLGRFGVQKILSLKKSSRVCKKLNFIFEKSNWGNFTYMVWNHNMSSVAITHVDSYDTSVCCTRNKLQILRRFYLKIKV